MVRRRGFFFAEAITPIEKTHRSALETNAKLDQTNRSLRERTLKLTASNRRLKQEIVKRRLAEEALRKRAPLPPVVGAVVANAGPIAADVPPAAVGARGRAQEDQSRTALMSSPRLSPASISDWRT